MTKHSDSSSNYTEDDIINMLEFLVDIPKVFEENVLRQIGDIHIVKKNTPLLGDIFQNPYEVEFIVFALGWKETGSISVQLHMSIHRLRIVH